MHRFVLLCSLLALGACGDCSQNNKSNPPTQDMAPDSQDMPADLREEQDQDADLPVDMGPDIPQELDLGPIPEREEVYTFASTCVTIATEDPYDLTQPGFIGAKSDETGFVLDAPEQAASSFRMRASGLGTYLLYDRGAHYLVVEEAGGEVTRKSELSSDIKEIEDGYLPGAQWQLQASPRDPQRYHFKHLKTGLYLTTKGLEAGVHRAALLDFTQTEGCAEFPELTLDASGAPRSAPFEDGSLFGIVETHSHILSNFGFGGAGIFHGSAFHPLGVEHALPSCEPFHGNEGRRDLFGFGFDKGRDAKPEDLLVSLVSGRTPEFNHFTDGYPTFTTWPSAHFSSTHQTQYYRWIERAWLGGLRLMVQHATTNQIICDLIAGQNTQPTRYSCSDMVAVDRIIEETYHMERYIDAQHGGPGKGWFRIVTSPAQAREVVAQGKLAIVLGIETSHLFDCFIVPPEDGARCTEQDVMDRLDEYWDRGVRVLFPVHKYDNGFSAGDGSRDLIEIGNFAQSGHWSNFTQDCPDVPTSFDKGRVDLGGLNMPRDDYFAPPPNDMSRFPDQPVSTLLDYVDELMAPALEGDYCQNAGLTPLGEFLLEEMMRRGIVIELDHLPRRSYVRAFEMLEAADYPGVGSHGNINEGKLYEIGGVSKSGFGRCSDPENPGGRMNRLRERVAQIEAIGGYPAEGLGLDLNGFAGAPGPRFGESSSCMTPQTDPITYPFTSFDGQVTFTQPSVGERQLDFNEEGLVHIGMIPELIEDLRHDGATDADLEPLFKSAEGYIRMWEKSERRAREIRGESP